MRFDIVALGVWVVPSRSSREKAVLGERESESCGRKKSRKLAQTVFHLDFSFLAGSFQRWFVTVRSSRSSSLGHLLSLWLLQERCCGRKTASSWEGRGREQRSFAGRG